MKKYEDERNLYTSIEWEEQEYLLDQLDEVELWYATAQPDNIIPFTPSPTAPQAA